MLGLVQVDVTERNGRAEVKTRLSARRRDAPQQPAQRQRLGRLHDRRARRHAADDRLHLRQHQGRPTSRATCRSTRSAAPCASPTAAGSRARSRSRATSRSPTPRSTARSRRRASAATSLLRKVSARRVDVGSVSGDVVLQDVQSDRVEAHSVSGNVDFGGALAKNGRYELNSHSGDVRVVVAGGTGFELEANSFSGSVQVRPPDHDAGRRRSATRAGAARSAASTATAARSSTSRRSPAASSFRSANATTSVVHVERVSPCRVSRRPRPGCPAHQRFSGRKRLRRSGSTWHFPCSNSSKPSATRCPYNAGVDGATVHAG